ncbi:MAG TPA: hypothetical protein PLC79_02535 [Phycisphaerae bacterium]|nr:hypothetical protein [Phycisphaerae bacterium]
MNRVFDAWRSLLIAAAGVIVGCGGDARVELSAADALSAVAGQMRVVFDEYHGEVEAHDDTRESAVVRAFVERVRRDSSDGAKLDQHASQFEAAMATIRADRRTEWQRRAAAETQVETILEVAKGLRRLGIESLSLQDEMRRYLVSWTESMRRAGTAAAGVGGATGRNAAAGSAGSKAPAGGAPVIPLCPDGNCDVPAK